MSEDLVILSGRRTPFGANGGSLKGVNPTDLGMVAGRAAIEDAGVQPDQIDHTIFGNVLHSAPDSIYSPRHIGLKLGIPQERPALGINRLCGSGFQVLVEAYHQMLAGDTDIALVGGIENMSMTPYAIWNARWGLKMGHHEVQDMMTTALTDSFTGSPMAITAEKLGEKYGVSREEADDFAWNSQQKAAQAVAAGVFSTELVPVEIPGRKGVQMVEVDEHPRPETTPESLRKLKSIFKKDGLVTAGTASGIVDGAAAMVVARSGKVQELGLKPLGRLVAYGVVGCDPEIMGIGPAPATRLALKRAGMTLDQMDLIEVNEAFAAQAVAVIRELEIPEEKVNVNGGAIAIGHPLGATGARIILHLMHELHRRKKKFALGTACIGGGQGIAVILEAFL